MPTGVPIRDVREQLFDAAGRVLRRDGPDALTSRAVTIEAGLAKGILHRHFADFDTFLASLVLTRIELLDHRSEELRSYAGSRGIADNLVAALTTSLDPDSLAIVGLVMSRRDLLARLRLTTPTGVPLLAEATRMIAAYLTAERGLGRITPKADVDQLALVLVGAAHLLLAGRERAPQASEVRQLVVTVIGGAMQEERDAVSFPASH
ncbi:AcrR family transcriptional regulator [Conexibacter arvalis]|uniref:AcrR family transcriptional regulator n=1 Tax=Conexibacter arvalis TaxID=912552 RepID=A0A840IMI9_9ACTN|nr:AcrR family transcriptional regulator [Conexibacter arvalis]